MKKILKVCMLILFSALTLVGCAGTNKLYDFAKANIAEVRENMYVGESDNLKVSLISGLREKDYVVNGLATSVVEFGVLTFVFKTEVALPETVNYVLTVGTTRYDGILEQNPYDGSFVCDVKTIINSNEVISAKIIAGEFVESVEVTSVTSNWNVNATNALKLACVELKNELAGFIENDEFYAECYIKIINDPDVDKNNYFWYVNFVGRNEKTFAVVIDPVSNEIMAKKTIWKLGGK